MARRVYRVSTCMKYVRGLLTDKPVLKVRMYNVFGEEFPRKVELVIDTGYEGSIMLNNNYYSFFASAELPREMWRMYRTLTGRVIMRVARALVEVGGTKLETYVETPLFGLGKNLAGREFLNKLVIVLDGIRRETCLCE